MNAYAQSRLIGDGEGGSTAKIAPDRRRMGPLPRQTWMHPPMLWITPPGQLRHPARSSDGAYTICQGSSPGSARADPQGSACCRRHGQATAGSALATGVPRGLCAGGRRQSGTDTPHPRCSSDDRRRRRHRWVGGGVHPRRGLVGRDRPDDVRAAADRLSWSQAPEPGRATFPRWSPAGRRGRPTPRRTGHVRAANRVRRRPVGRMLGGCVGLRGRDDDPDRALHPAPDAVRRCPSRGDRSGASPAGSQARSYGRSASRPPTWSSAATTAST